MTDSDNPTSENRTVSYHGSSIHLAVLFDNSRLCVVVRLAMEPQSMRQLEDMKVVKIPMLLKSKVHELAAIGNFVNAIQSSYHQRPTGNALCYAVKYCNEPSFT